MSSSSRQTCCRPLENSTEVEECLKYVKIMSKDILKCGRCRENFNTRSRQPLMLPCFHAFCENCIRVMTTEDKITCTQCMRSTPATFELPVDKSRLALRLFRHGLWTREGMACEGCAEERSKASSYCKNCREFLCDQCRGAHSRVKFTRNHNVYCLGQVAKAPAHFVISNDDCELHPTEKVRFYCSCCRKTACGLCMRDIHKECSGVKEGISVLDTILPEKKREVKANVEKIDVLAQSFEKKLNICERYKESVELNLCQALKQVEVIFEELMTTLKERREVLTEQLRAYAQADSLKLDEESMALKRLVSLALTASDYGRRVLALNAVGQLLDHNQGLENTIAVLKERTGDMLRPPQGYEIQHGNMAEVQATLQEFGAISKNDIYVNYVTGACK